MQTTGDLENQSKASFFHHRPTRKTSVEEAGHDLGFKGRIRKDGVEGHGLFIRKCSGFIPATLGQEEMWGGVGVPQEGIKQLEHSFTQEMRLLATLRNNVGRKRWPKPSEA